MLLVSVVCVLVGGVVALAVPMVHVHRFSDLLFIYAMPRVVLFCIDVVL